MGKEHGDGISYLSRQEIEREFAVAVPTLDQFRRALVHNGKSLPLAEEKIAKKGFAEIQALLGERGDWIHSDPLIIEACRGTASSGYEINRFAELVWNTSIPIAHIFVRLSRLCDTEPAQVKRVSPVHHIFLRGAYYEVRNGGAYLSEPEGLRRLARLPQKSPSTGIFDRILHPNPVKS